MSGKHNIHLAPADTCTGCSACVSICPTKSITMIDDKEGFLQPYIDTKTCIGCRKCEKTCPIITPLEIPTVIETKFYAAQLKNKEDLLEVSSGGAFWALAQTILDERGIIYGAAQVGVDEVRHIRVDNAETAKQLRRSKYLPSKTEGIYEAVKNDLDKGKSVLFSGVGCQIAGLRSYLHKGFENLITCDVVCHGIPSLKAWKAYRKEKEELENKKLVDVIFRNKSKGWKNNQYKMTYEDGSEEYCLSVQHPFHKAYLDGILSRKSCSVCKFANLERLSDITLADYWQYQGSRLNPTNGVSLVVVHSAEGEKLLNRAKQFIELEPTSKEKAVASCRHLTHTPLQHKNRDAFFEKLSKLGYTKAIDTSLDEKENFIIRGLKKVYRLAKKIAKNLRVKTSDNDRCVIKSYYQDLGKQVFFVESPCEYWRLFACRSKELLTANKISRKIAKICGIKGIIDPQSITTVAQQYAAIKEALLLLHRKGVPVYFYHRVGKEENFTYSKSALHRMENDLSFPKMYENIDAYMPEFKELIGPNVTREYVENIGKITQIIKKGNYLCHEDITGSCVNVIGGKRITTYQPINSNRTIHVYGRCGAFGYAVEDKDTLPSQLQWFINQAGYNDIKVVNHGLWGGEDKNIDHDFLLDMLGMKEGDIVLFYRHFLDPHIMAQLEKRGMWYKDITHEWHQHSEASWCFYNYPGHMSAVGYRNAAELICNDLIAHQFKCRPIDIIFATQTPKSDHINYYLKKHAHNDAFDSEILQYVAHIKEQFPLRDGMKCGAIVMNCNPFTYGHRYLIETASKQVDRLYIFVVEEDKSFFKFNDRFEMVKQGTADIKNVCVVPSGNFIISAFTFPEYFMKDYVKEKGFDMSSDVEIFGSKIAPALNIIKRFAGEEPFDVVTAKYNETMKEILPQYGVEFVEIPRATTNDNVVINATLVRKMLQEGNLKDMELFVPQSTINILRSKYVK